MEYSFAEKKIFSSPEELLREMVLKLKKSEPVISEYDYISPSEIRKTHVADENGAADFQYEELTKMGYEVVILFVFNDKILDQAGYAVFCYPFTLYKRDDLWYRFDWASAESRGIGGPYSSYDEIVRMTMSLFEKLLCDEDIQVVEHKSVVAADKTMYTKKLPEYLYYASKGRLSEDYSPDKILNRMKVEYIEFTSNFSKEDWDIVGPIKMKE